MNLDSRKIFHLRSWLKERFNRCLQRNRFARELFSKSRIFKGLPVGDCLAGDRCFGDRCFGDRCVGDRCFEERCVGDRCVEYAVSGTAASGTAASGTAALVTFSSGTDFLVTAALGTVALVTSLQVTASLVIASSHKDGNRTLGVFAGHSSWSTNHRGHRGPPSSHARSLRKSR